MRMRTASRGKKRVEMHYEKNRLAEKVSKCTIFDAVPAAWRIQNLVNWANAVVIRPIEV